MSQLFYSFVLSIITSMFFCAAAFNGNDCPAGWSDHFQSGLSASAADSILFDDGSGEALYVGGDFVFAGGQNVGRIAKWDGHSWSPVGTTGGMNGIVRAFAIFDDGTGPALYVGGEFTTAGGVAANRIVKWTGSTWEPLGSGTNGTVYALAVYDNGTGPALYVGGHFGNAGGVTVQRLARWDGANWSAVGGIGNNEVRTMLVADMGDGEALYIGGSFTTIAGFAANRIAKYKGNQWSAFSSGVSGTVHSLAVYDDGNGPALYVGGAFTTAGGASIARIAKWDGNQFSALPGNVNNNVTAMGVFDDGTGEALFMAGTFSLPWNRAVKFDGTTFSPLTAPGGFNGLSAQGNSFTVWPSRDALMLVGSFTTVANIPSQRVAEWRRQATPIDITEHPADAAVQEGEMVVLTAAAQSEDEVSFQWRRDGEEIEGATSDSLVFEKATTELAGVYDALVFNECLEKLTKPATVTIKPSKPGVIGDLNNDGVVNVSDLLILFASWGACSDGEDCPADLNGDGDVNVSDLLILFAAWG